MIDTAKPTLRLIRGGRTDNDGRQSVDLYRHDTAEVRSIVWTLAHLMGGIRQRRPRRPGDPDWTFSIGRRRVLAITTEGPRKFSAQGAVRGADGLVEELSGFSDLTLTGVERLAREFFAGVYDPPCHRRSAS